MSGSAPTSLPTSMPTYFRKASGTPEWLWTLTIIALLLVVLVCVCLCYFEHRTNQRMKITPDDIEDLPMKKAEKGTEREPKRYFEKIAPI